MEVDEMELVGEPHGRSGDNMESGSDLDSEICAEDVAWSLDQLFDRIMQECRHNSPGECFSAKVRRDIESMEPGRRAELVSQQRHGAAPLFAACARGNLACAEYLLHVCGAELEQRGQYRAPGSSELHNVTPLWAAAVSGRLDVLTALADAGADIDAGSDSGSTPLRSACFMTHTAVARFLVERGADVKRPNHNGGTCLVNSVQSTELCRLLIDAGADVDALDLQLKTALHYAVQEHREDTVRLLLAAGANPLRATRDGDDALRIAALKGAAGIVHALLAACAYSAARAADAYELLGATQLDELNDAAGARASWHAATAIRVRGAAPKRPLRGGVQALRGLREWRGAAELAAHAHDADWLRAQALLVTARVLGDAHHATPRRLMARGAALADANRAAHAVPLWLWALELRIRHHSLLDPETCQTLLALTRLLREAQDELEPDAELSVRHVATDLLRTLATPPALPECQRLMAATPRCRTQGNMFDRALRCVLHLAHLAHSAPSPHEDLSEPSERAALEADYREQIRLLVALDLRACATGDTLLHLACSRLNVVRSTYFENDIELTVQRSIFPSCDTARLLLQCGASVSQRNNAHCTPLHVAAIPYNFSTELVETLLAWGAHLDQPNRFGDSPAELVQLNAASRVRVLQHVTLACRAARALASRAAPAAPALPATLRPFLLLHQP